LDKITEAIQVIDFNNEFFKLISEQFEHPDYKDLYENHSLKTNSKTGGYVNTFISKVETNDDDEEALDKKELFVLATLNTIQKCFVKVLNTKILYFDSQA
jgi:hypothetical protein